MRISAKTRKRAMMMSVGLALATLIVLTRFFMLSSDAMFGAFSGRKVGQNVYWFTQALGESENALLHEDIFWKFAAREALLKTLENGGNNKCLVGGGFRFWESAEQGDCYPTERTFKSTYHDFLTYHFMRGEPQSNSVRFNPNPKHEFYIGESEGKLLVMGVGLNLITTDMTCTSGERTDMVGVFPDIFRDRYFLTSKFKENEGNAGVPKDSCGRIYSKHSFREVLDFDIEIVTEKAVWDAAMLHVEIEKCLNNGGTGGDCRFQAIDYVNANGELEYDKGCGGVHERYFSFCGDTGKKIFAYNGSIVDFHPAIVKFALYVPGKTAAAPAPEGVEPQNMVFMVNGKAGEITAVLKEQKPYTILEAWFEFNMPFSGNVAKPDPGIKVTNEEGILVVPVSFPDMTCRPISGKPNRCRLATGVLLDPTSVGMGGRVWEKGKKYTFEMEIYEEYDDEYQLVEEVPPPVTVVLS